MNLTPLSEIKKTLEKELSPSRYHHSVAVARLAKKLARFHQLNGDDAERAGLVHDCAKEWSPAQLLNLIQKRKIKVPHLDFIRTFSPNMMHAYVGAVVALERGWINRQQQKAVAAHTLGDLSMTTLDKTIYISDFAAYDRGYKQARKVRKLAEENLEQAFIFSMKFKISSSLKRSKPVHPLAIEVWNHVNSR